MLEVPIAVDPPVTEGRSHSYRMEALDAPAELARLARQVEVGSVLEDELLGMLALDPGAHVLDLGCGPGFFAERLARRWLPTGRVTGVDVDPELLARGRARLAEEGLAVELRAGSAVALPLADGAVDMAYARFLFQHLSEPERALAEMIRVTRPGGRVVVVDTDDGGLVVHPAPEGLAALLDASARAQRARGGDRFVGRKLGALLARAGLVEVRHEARLLTTASVSPADLVGVALGFKAAGLGPPYMEAEVARAVVRQLHALAAEPGFFGHATAYAAWGRVPC